MPHRAFGSPRDARVLPVLPPSAERIDTRPVRPMRIRHERRGVSARYAVCSCQFGAAYRRHVPTIPAPDLLPFVTAHGRWWERTRMHLITLATAVFVVALAAEPGRSQTPSSTEAAVADAHTATQPATLIYANRPIVEFRATWLGRTPAERAAAAVM